MKLIFLNGSIHGSQKNCGEVLKTIAGFIERSTFKDDLETQVIDLVDLFSSNGEHDSLNLKLHQAIRAADAFIFITGTYWDSWGSPLQYFLEKATEWEGQDELFAKPCGIIVLHHSVGGKGVSSRLQGVLNSMGLYTPPMSSMVLGLATELALNSDNRQSDDFWQSKDLEILLNNVCIAAKMDRTLFRRWDTDRLHYNLTWWRQN